MNNDTQHNTIISTVTERIHSGSVRMKPEWQFISKSILLGVLGLGIFLTSSLILNIILFTIHFQGTETLLGFGQKGWFAFIHFFPWGLLTIDLLLIMLLIIVTRSFRVGYKVPLLYLGGALLAMVIIAGVVVEQHTPTNNFFMREHVFEMERPMHRVLGRAGIPPQPQEGMCRCEIIEIMGDNTMRVRDIHTGEMFLAQVTNTSYATTTGLIAGMRLMLAGDMDNGVLHVFGLKFMGERSERFLPERILK